MSRDPSSVTLPRIEASEVRLLWVNDWYDAPVEAVVDHAGARCLLRLEDPSALETDRAVRWLMYPLAAAQLAEHERWHDAYVHHVGEHWCFHEAAHERRATAEADAERFLAEHHGRTPVPLEELIAIGWLDALPLR